MLSCVMLLCWLAGQAAAESNYPSRPVRIVVPSPPAGGTIDALPGVPPVARVGVPKYDAMQWYGLLAPAGTPPEIIALLRAEAVKVLHTEDMKEKLASDGAEPVGSTPAEFAALITSELEKWTNVARVAKIEPQ
jgi:tripartite-type tricarboxylate transporter receptor subunit TctC